MGGQAAATQRENRIGIFMLIYFDRRLRKIFVLILIAYLFFACECRNSSLMIHPAMEMKPIPEGLGVNIHFYEGNDNDWNMIDKAGIGIVRMDVSWNGIEKEPGVYDFSRHDKLIQKLSDRDIRLLFIIDYGNSLYDDGQAPHSEAGRKAYAQFCTALAARYADKEIIWELWNEPNLDHFWKPRANVENYMAWCHQVVPEIRSNDPDACIVGPAISSGLPWKNLLV